MANVDGRPSDAEMYIAPEHVSMVSMHTNPIHRRRPPMLRLPSENGSAAGRSVMQSSHALLPEPTTIPAVTNDINVVDADQHIQNDQARSELFVYTSTCPHILCLADVWGMQEKIVMHASHAVLPELTTIPEVTNGINVVDADHDIQNDQARSECNPDNLHCSDGKQCQGQFG
jgi:hypothetical protein